MNTSIAPMELPKRQKGFRYELRPTPEQATELNMILGSARKVWNILLSDAQADYQAYQSGHTDSKPNVSGYSFVKQSTTLKARNDLLWLGRITSIAIQQKALDLGTAFTNLFKGHNAYPRFKKRGYNDSFRIVGEDAIRINEYGVIVPKTTTGTIQVLWSRELPSAPTSYTITRTSAGRYYVSFICTYVPRRQSGMGRIGIDVGLKDLATMSDGTAIENPHWYVQAQKRLASLQRSLSRKVQNSNGYHQARLKLAECHEYIRNARSDYLHKLTSRLVGDNQAICIETLQVSNMSKNHSLAKHILDAGWAIFRSMLAYKARESSNTYLILADQWYPSTQLCSHCNLRPTVKIILSQRQWTCEHCGTHHHRDHNASKNLEALIEPTLREAGLANRVIMA